MVVQVYQMAGRITPNIARATLVAEIEVDDTEVSDVFANQLEFAREHGGDFIEVLHEELAAA